MLPETGKGRKVLFTRISVKNFKSIGDGPDGGPGVDIELKPLTFLVGANGSGKSSILEGIALACDGGRGPLLLEYNDRDLPFRKSLNVPIVVALSFKPGALDVNQQHTMTYKLSLTVQQRGSGRSDEITIEDQSLSLGDEASRQLLTRVLDRLKQRRDLAFIRGSRGDVTRESRRTQEGVPMSWPGDGGPEINESQAWVGLYGENLLPLLALIFGRREYESIRVQISEAARPFGMSGLNAGWWGAPATGSDYEDTALRVALRTQSASLGGRQALTVIAQVSWCRSGGLTMIEEPEISLHPAAQVEMCRFLATQASRGKQILATTHSPFMLLALRKPILEKIIAAEDVAIYHVERNLDLQAGEIGVTVAKRLPLAKEGYLEEWVPSFSKVERDLAKEWAQAVDRVEKAGTTVRRTRRKDA